MELKEEQKRVVFHDEGDLLVSASAGSGKTFTVIRRLIRLIVEGKARVGEILAVTFTEKAAAEMKAKLQNALAEAIAAGNTGLKEQFGEVYTADICTVHAFCGRLLRKYFFEAGLSPDFEIADEVQAGELRDGALSALFEELYVAEDEAFLLLVSRHTRRRKDGELKETVLSLYDFARSEADPAAALKEAVRQYAEERGGFYFDELEKDIRRRCAAYARPFGEYAAQFSALGEEKLASYAARLASMAESGAKSREGLPSLPSKCLTEEGAALKEELRAEREAYFKAMGEYAALGEREEEISKFAACGAHTAALVDLTEKFAARYAAEKREQNLLDFADLEHFALALLKNERVRADVRGRYKYVFADEYQDTNGVQEALLAGVSGGNLFMVGDLKQSIYAFRGCNPALFEKKEEALAESGGVMYLNRNFRSAPAVLDGVNEIFDYCMKKDFSGVDYAGTSRLRTGGGYKEHAGRFSFDVLRRAEKEEESAADPKVYDVLEHPAGAGEDFAEADFIADLIEEEIGKPYFDVETGEERGVEYGDIAVLVRSRNAFTERLVRRLVFRGIPVDAESGGVKESAEIRALIDALRLADNRKQDIPLCSALKNLYSFSDEDLAKIRLYANEKLRGERDVSFVKACECCMRGEGELSARLGEAAAAFGRLALYGAHAGAGAFLRAVLGETALERRIAASPAGARKLKNVERFLAEADAAGCTVREFLRRIDSAGAELQMSEAAGENAVKVLTVHASKGLEYPVVFVAGTDKSFNFADSRARIVKKRGYGFAVPFYDEEKKTVADTVFGKYLKKEVRAETVREEMRLFYVALTRAKYSLHVVGTGRAGEKPPEEAGCFAHFLPRGLAANERAEILRDGAAPRREKVIVDGGDGELAAMIRRNLDFVYPYAADCVLPLKTSVTAEAAAEDGDDYNYLDLEEETSSERGTAMHKFLEHYRFDGADAESELSRQLAEGLLSAEDAALLDMRALKRLLAGDVFGMLGGYALYKERWFMINVPAAVIGKEGSGIMLQGIVDLLAVKDGEAIIVDYKYSAKDADSLVRAYRKQLSLYKYAVESALGLKVKAAYLVSLAEAKALAVSV